MTQNTIRWDAAREILLADAGWVDTALEDRIAASGNEQLFLGTFPGEEQVSFHHWQLPFDKCAHCLSFQFLITHRENRAHPIDLPRIERSDIVGE